MYNMLDAIGINEAYVGKVYSGTSYDLHVDVNSCSHIHYRLDTHGSIFSFGLGCLRHDFTELSYMDILYTPSLKTKK
jgi:hypothetical protein